MADDASIRVLAELNILLPNQGFIDMYNMPSKWLQIHSSRHRTTQASSIFVLLSACLLFASSLCCTARRIQTKQKKVATVAKNVCQAAELGLQRQPFDIHCSWETVSVLNQTTDGSWEKWMQLHNLWRKTRLSLQSGGAILWWQWRRQSCSDLNTWRTFSCR